MLRGRKKAGRGYNMAAWIKHHQQIVERVEKQNRLHTLESTTRDHPNKLQYAQNSDGYEEKKQRHDETSLVEEELFPEDTTEIHSSSSTEDYVTGSDLLQRCCSTSTLPGQQVPESVSEESNVGTSTVRVVGKSTYIPHFGKENTRQNSPRQSIATVEVNDMEMSKKTNSQRDTPGTRGTNAAVQAHSKEDRIISGVNDGLKLLTQRSNTIVEVDDVKMADEENNQRDTPVVRGTNATEQSHLKEDRMNNGASAGFKLSTKRSKATVEVKDIEMTEDKNYQRDTSVAQGINTADQTHLKEDRIIKGARDGLKLLMRR